MKVNHSNRMNRRNCAELVMVVFILMFLLAPFIAAVPIEVREQGGVGIDNYVERLIAGANITLDPETGLGVVTISSTGGNGMPENYVKQIIAGTRILISPENGYGVVTVNVDDNALVWLENHEGRLVDIESQTYVNWLTAGDRIHLSANTGSVTITVNDNALTWLEDHEGRISTLEGTVSSILDNLDAVWAKLKLLQDENIALWENLALVWDNIYDHEIRIENLENAVGNGAEYDPYARRLFQSMFGENWPTTTSGTGYIAVNSVTNMQIGTGTTAGSYMDINGNLVIDGTKNTRFEWTASMGATNQYWAGLFMGLFLPASYNTTTVRRYGFHIVNDATYSNRILAVTCGGAGVTLTDVGPIATGASRSVLGVEFTAGVKAEFYVDGVLKATHTTNLPTTGVNFLHQMVKSIDANDSILLLAMMRGEADY